MNRIPVLAVAALGLLGPGAPPASAQEEPQCPEGRVAVRTDDPYDPVACMTPGEAERESNRERIGHFKAKPKCPQGTRPIMTPGRLQRYRCLAVVAPRADPAMGLPSAGRGEKLLDRGAAPPPPLKAAKQSGHYLGYRPYRLARQFKLDVPLGWHLTDAWKDEVPTLYLELETGRTGKGVTIVVSLYSQGREGYVDMATAIKREKAWVDAKEAGRGKVGGRQARFTAVAKQSRTAYVPNGVDSYLTLAYSAPAELYDAYEPAYERALKSLQPIAPGRED